MEKQVLLRKIAFVLIFYGIYYNVVFYFLKPDIYEDFFFLTYIIILYIFGSIDALVRPIEVEEQEQGNFVKYILFLFIISPFLLILAITENEFLFDRRLSILSWIGLVIYLVAAIIVLLSRTQLGHQGTGVLVIREEHELITSGIYKYIRHPIYAGSLVGVGGFILISQSIAISLITFILYFSIFNNRIQYEEKILIEEFGEKYVNYMNASKRLIPFVY
ncbi:MAG: methyltransferase family protein [Candidatus Kariarchaeaceae archaeon]|jgi:protein-S-isoprenylcysteine O-methyltransferase Ste14